MSQIGQIICRDKKDAKTAKIQECLKVPRVWIIISDFLKTMKFIYNPRGTKKG